MILKCLTLVRINYMRFSSQDIRNLKYYFIFLNIQIITVLFEVCIGVK